MTSNDIVFAIHSGTHDDQLNAIREALSNRTKTIQARKAGEALATLRVGDKITMSGTIRPKKLAGAPGAIVGQKGGKFVVNLDFPVFTSSTKSWQNGITCPPELLVKATPVA